MDEPGGLLHRHRRDLWIVALTTLGALLVLCCWFGALGIAGHWLDVGLGRLIGWARYLVPLGLLAAAGVLLASRTEPEPVRVGVGGGLVLLAVCGLCDLAAARPSVTASGAVLSSAGGWIGVAIGGPLAAGIGAPGAAVVLVAAALVGVVLLTGVTLRALYQGATTGATQGARHLARWWGGGTLVRGPAARRRRDDDDDDGELEDEYEYEDEDGEYEEDDDDDVAAAPSARRVRDADPTAELTPTGEVAVVVPATRPPAASVHTGDWTLPDPGLLARTKVQRLDHRGVETLGAELVEALDAHGVDTQLVGFTVGPTVTRYELELGPGVKVARVTSLSKDIAYAMASPDVRILAPIPGRSAIGVEVPNQRRTLVTLGDLLATPEAATATHPLDVALGRDIAGRPVFVNLAEMPHVLISGATGAGKSSCINALVTSIVMRATPDQVRLILVDPKRVELGNYNDLPHLLGPVVVDPKKAAGALSWAVREMERRYDLLAEHGVRDLAGYNEALARGELARPGPAPVADVVAGVVATTSYAPTEPVATGADAAERLPFVVIVVDELNDLMMVAARDVEESVVRIAQMARAVGIHLVLATQRPSVDVITGVIKANIPSRMAFAVSSLADSRVILDQQGAERLIGKGDMLLLTANSNVTRRIQSPWVSEEEVRAVVTAWRRQGRVSEPVVAQDLDAHVTSRGPTGDEDDEELLRQARELVVRSQLGSTSMLQRKLRVGFARAGRLMDLLELEGTVGPSEGSKARAVLLHPDELDTSR
ncbi:MAG TPA: DNA translocase FtsK [Acidimicrobiales bacterium]|nr:DNA translocase FtsK [Acidimicrobiales bacterium]